ncbi:MAG TPA: (d)CMP kinase [Gemmatimonadaceae bacterium]|nr:(d)CMP kinase [Gemmatimonadaceae bacterium]
MKRNVVIAIDGPAASGKSSTAQWVAERLGFRHVDSGALYRAATAARLRMGGSPETWTEDEVLENARRSVTLVPTPKGFAPQIDGVAVDDEIRGSEVTRNVSLVARMERVREWVNQQVRDAGRAHSVVVDGRDIGSAVFPDAEVKIFLVADPWERARRRLIQRLQRAPTDQEIAEETDQLVHRDAKDARQSGQAADAILLDTTYLTQEEQVDRIVALAKAVTQRGDSTSNG